MFCLIKPKDVENWVNSGSLVSMYACVHAFINSCMYLCLNVCRYVYMCVYARIYRVRVFMYVPFSM